MSISYPFKLMGRGYRELPTGYIECEYLESTGTQWIDTGYKPNNRTQLFLIFNWVDTNPWDMVTCYTQWDSSGRGVSIGSGWRGGALLTTYVCNTNVVFYPVTKNIWYESGSNIGGKAYVSFLNGELIKSEDFDSVSGGQFQLDFSIPLFRGRNRYSFYGITKSKIAKFSILENDVLIQNLIPALDPSGVPCMYDTVGNKPYYNQGTGTFSYKIKD